MGVSGDGGLVTILGDRGIVVLRRDSSEPACRPPGCARPMPRYLPYLFSFCHNLCILRAME